MDIQIGLVYAVIGGVGGAVVSALTNSLNQHWERQHRRREVIFAKSMEMALERRKFMMDLADKEGDTVIVPPDFAIAAKLYLILSYLFDNGCLPEAVRLELERQRGEQSERIEREFASRI